MTIDNFLWGVYPYIALTMLVVVTAIRRMFFQRTWTSKSSEFLEKKKEKFGNPIFHLMLLFVLFGHLGGLLVPKAFTEALGVTEHMYHMVAFIMGGLAGCGLAVGLFILITRRFGGNKRMKVSTSTSDKVMYVFLAATILMGLFATFSNAGGGFVYRDTIAPWIRGVLVLQPDPTLMYNIPLAFKIHLTMAFTFFAMLPFTRIVHMFSGITAPFKYLGRAAIVYRRRKQKERAYKSDRALDAANR